MVEMFQQKDVSKLSILNTQKLSKLTRLSFTAHFLLQCSYYFFCQKKSGDAHSPLLMAPTPM